MPMTLLFALAAASATTCAPVDGWNAGRAGKSATCAEADYAEGHKLGTALRELIDERDALQKNQASLNDGAKNLAQRRQRQLQNDIEALQAVATVRGWPYDGKPAPGKVQ